MKKILIIKHGSLGDIVFALPALASIRETYSDAEIYVLTENKYINFFKRWNIFDFCFEDNRKESFFKSLYTLFKLLNIDLISKISDQTCFFVILGLLIVLFISYVNFKRYYKKYYLWSTYSNTHYYIYSFHLPLFFNI